MNEPQSTRTRVAILAGARSTEHEVSLISAYNIIQAIDTNKYEVFVIGIDKQGIWHQYDPTNFVTNPTDISQISLANPISGRLTVAQSSSALYDIDNHGKVAFQCDVIFPAVLGNYAEDGTMQGLLRMMDVPFTTSDVLGSSVGMDKDVAYRLFRDANIPVATFVTLRKNATTPTFTELKEELQTEVLFVKPANAGSSVGVSRVTSETEYQQALHLAFRYDVKVIAQAGIVGRELEIGVIGIIGQQRASVVGEIIEKDTDDFYSYENKYVHSSHVELLAPTEISDSLHEKIKDIAIQGCEAIEVEGFARVDFLVSEDETVYLNEINTMPGFTAISMFPRLWQESGLSYPKLIDTLLQTALERHKYRIAPIITDAADVLAIAKQATVRHEQ